MRAIGEESQLTRSFKLLTVPLFTPLLHLSNFLLLTADNILRELLNFGAIAFLRRLICHVNGTLMVWNHGVDEAQIKLIIGCT